MGGEAYAASIDAVPSGRYLYYVPGAHRGGDRDGTPVVQFDGTPVVQFDVKTGRKKVIAFLARIYAGNNGNTTFVT